MTRRNRSSRLETEPRRFVARALRALNVPNIITLIRLGLVPAMAYYLIDEAYEIALPIFLVAALSDLADGYIARKFKLVSTLGATLDPIADKLSMLVATVLLAWQTLLPLWLAVAIVARDIVIVLGAILFLLARGRLEIAPTRLSKINTFNRARIHNGRIS